MCTTRPKPSSRRASWAGCPDTLVALLLAWLLLAPVPLRAEPAGLVAEVSAWRILENGEEVLWPAPEPKPGPALYRWVAKFLGPDGRDWFRRFWPASAWEPGPVSYRWDARFPGVDGHALFRLTLPVPIDGEPRALLFSRIGNQAVVRVNGSIVTRMGEPGQTTFDAAKTSWLVTLPEGTLRRDGANQLQVEVWCQAGRWGGLSQVQYGPLSALELAYRQQRLWRFNVPVIMASGFVLMGLTALALWWRQRLAAYGWFAAAAMLGVVRHIDRVWPDLPVPWPLWGGLAAAAYAAHVMLMFRVGLEMLEVRSTAMHRLLLGTLVVVTTLALLAFVGHWPKLWSAGLSLLLPYGLAVDVCVARTAWPRRRTGLGAAMLVAAVVLTATGLFDRFVVREGVGLEGGGYFSTTPVALFVIAVLMTGYIISRHNAAVDAYRKLNAELAARVAERERQLHEVFDSLNEQRREQAVTEERQRLMREIHDGVGAQLVLLQNLAATGRADPATIEQQAGAALDELRMAVDSLQPVHGDLGTVLATMRYRLQPRLEAAGLAMKWDVGHLPPLPDLLPQAVLQVHRIVLEAMTNVLRHAGARTLVVSAQAVQRPQPAIVVVLRDDGIGIPEDLAGKLALQSRGHGLVNMHTRAESIGAQLSVTRGEGGGTQVTLVWPQQPPAIS